MKKIMLLATLSIFTLFAIATEPHIDYVKVDIHKSTIKWKGSKVTEGEIVNNLNARLIRDGNVLYTGAINSIFREKNAAKQVAAGLECGITLKDFADFKEKDVIEVYKNIETERRI